MTASSLSLQSNFDTVAQDLFLKCKPDHITLLKILSIAYYLAWHKRFAMIWPPLGPLTSFLANCSHSVTYTQIHTESSFTFYAFVGVAHWTSLPLLRLLKHKSNHLFYDILSSWKNQPLFLCTHTVFCI